MKRGNKQKRRKVYEGSICADLHQSVSGMNESNTSATHLDFVRFCSGANNICNSCCGDIEYIWSISFMSKI